MSIDAVLRSHQLREGTVPEFWSEDTPSNENRWGRHRFDPNNPGGLELPWIAMNPAGSRGGSSRTGNRIFEWSWRWGFDRCVVYNVRPHKDADSSRANKTIVSDDEIDASHAFIADRLRECDAVIVAWGSEKGEQKGWAKRLLERINFGRSTPIATWCLGTNKSGHPKHPGARANVPLSKQAEQWFPDFVSRGRSQLSRSISSMPEKYEHIRQEDNLVSILVGSTVEHDVRSSVGSSPALQEAAHGFALILGDNLSLRWEYNTKTRITIYTGARRLLRLRKDGNVDLVIHADVVKMSDALRAMMKPRGKGDFTFSSSDVEKTKEIMSRARAAFSAYETAFLNA